MGRNESAAGPGRAAWVGHRHASDGDARRTFAVFGATVEADAILPGLHVVATPIGNLRDVTLRALATLAAADAVLAEDTRVSRVLLAHYGISTPLVPYHDHNAALMCPRILARLAKGEALALISDAGTPLVSDPGFKLLTEVMGAGHLVTTAPGASAVPGRPRAGRAADRSLLLRRLSASEIGARGEPGWPSWRPFRALWCSSNRRVGFQKCWPMSPPFWVPGRPRSRAN